MTRSAWRWATAFLLLVMAGTGTATAQSPPPVDATAFGRGVPIKSAWVAAAGDDPQWASPALDDSRWTVLRPGKPLPLEGFDHARSIWYRAHVQLRPDPPPMSLYTEGLHFNYMVYANGVLIGQQGSMDVTKPNQLHPAEGFRIPPEILRSSNGHLLLAVHVAGGPVGFLNMAPLDEGTHFELMSPGEIPFRQSFRLAHDWSESFALLALNLLVGLCGLVIWWSLRQQQEYLALAAWLLCNAATVVINFSAHLLSAAPTSLLGLFLVFVMATSSVAELEFMRLLLKRKQSILWITLEAIAFLVDFVIPIIETGKLPLRLAPAVVFVRPLITEIFVGFVLLRGARRGNRDAPLLLLPVALWSFSDIYNIVQLIVWFGLRVYWPDLPRLHVFSYTIGFNTLADALGLLSLVLIILLRTVRLSEEKAELSAEVAAAEQLQVLLMARASRPTPGYLVETVYRPMQQVGGDFFLVQPCEEDDSLVAIVGDVSGKGLQAAMRVSMILGVLQREVMGRPEKVLRKLNHALLDQNDLGFTTACCVRLEADGSFSFANAGHLNPYLDGEELASEGALPLGMDPEAEYPVFAGRLKRGQRLVLLSDGVLEARSRKGELLGFERMGELVRRGTAEIAEAAQRFGQEDDITVLALALAATRGTPEGNRLRTVAAGS